MSENSNLNYWCGGQRAQKRHIVTEDQIERLNAIGFVWDKGAKFHFKQMREERFIELKHWSLVILESRPLK